MIFCFYFFWADDALDRPVFIDDEGRAKRPHISPSAHFLFRPYAELLLQRGIRIGYQVERELLFGDKSLMGLRAIFTYAQHFISLLL